jgi:DNA-binding transcriptional ArsR family regulator
MNMLTEKAQTQVAEYLKLLGAPFRIQILFSIGYGEACVCHLEAVLNKRQAYISQHLMVMRDAGILDTRREGKYVYYRVADRNLFDLIKLAASILNISLDNLPELSTSLKQKNCDCPHCHTDIN